MFCTSSESLWGSAWTQTTSTKWDEEGGQEEPSPPIFGDHRGWSSKLTVGKDVEGVLANGFHKTPIFFIE